MRMITRIFHGRSLRRAKVMSLATFLVVSFFCGKHKVVLSHLRSARGAVVSPASWLEVSERTLKSKDLSLRRYVSPGHFSRSNFPLKFPESFFPPKFLWFPGFVATLYLCGNQCKVSLSISSKKMSPPSKKSLLSSTFEGAKLSGMRNLYFRCFPWALE